MTRTCPLPPILLITLLPAVTASGQPYHPPVQASAPWETVAPETLGWCTEQLPPLLGFLEQSNTKAFIVLKDGRIAIEHYFGTFTADSTWYWASAGKCLTSFLVGLAQEDGDLDINDPASQYLGAGWTSLTPAQEDAITVWHQLTMTSGLDDGVPNNACTEPSCLRYLAEPGTRWAYHNAPYTLLDGVLTNATGQALNGYLFNKLTLTTGLTGLYLPLGYNNVFFSRARSMARFGLLMQGGGAWAGNPILSDAAYYQAMITPSQSLNEAYGYLWWLNGRNSYQLPGVQLQVPGPIMPDAPLDAFNALGANGQVLNVSPGTGLVVVRMGELPGGVFVPNVYNNQIWQYLNAVICAPTAVQDQGVRTMRAHPNPATDRLELQLPGAPGPGVITITDAMGRVVGSQTASPDRVQLDVAALASGSYSAIFRGEGGVVTVRFVKE